MWFDILLALQTRFIGHKDLQGVAVQVGATRHTPKDARIILLRGKFDPLTTEPTSRESQELKIQCWEYSKDEDPMVGYQRLNDLEKIVISILNDFGRGDTTINGKKIRVRIGGTIPDGDVFRPAIGSETTVTIKWQ